MEMYSPVRGRIINDEEVLHRGVRTYCMAKGDLEAMLQRQFGKKLEPVRTKGEAQGRGRARKLDENTVVFFPTQKALKD